MGLEECRVIDLPKKVDHRGTLAFIEEMRHVPFIIRRVFFIYDVPPGETRGGHAHRLGHQLLLATSGSFDMRLDDGRGSCTFHLNRPYLGLYVPPLIWGEMDNFSAGAVCMALASDYYSEEDYYRDYEDFARGVTGPDLTLSAAAEGR